jgi:hypothetical protein
MRSVWKAIYQGHEIIIENSWFNGERLFVDNELQDETFNMASARLTGVIKNKEGGRIPIKANLGGVFQVNCFLFVDNKKVAVDKV